MTELKNNYLTKYKYLAVLDFEATCWKDSNRHEIIEFPTVIVDVESKEIIDRIQIFVKPRKDSKLSDFCKLLTGITQEQVDSGTTLTLALQQHREFMSRYPNSIFVTCGDWDLLTMFPMDAKNNKIINYPDKYSRWINIKKSFAKVYNDNGKYGMPDMLYKLKLDLIGRHHSGIDDCVNIARISIQLLKDGWIPEITTRLK